MENQSEEISAENENESSRQSETPIPTNENSRGNLEVSAYYTNLVRNNEIPTNLTLVEQVIEMETDENNINTSNGAFVQTQLPPYINTKQNLEGNLSGLDSTFGFNNMFSSTLNESLLNQSYSNTTLAGKELICCSGNDSSPNSTLCESGGLPVDRIAELESSVLDGMVETVSQDENGRLESSLADNESSIGNVKRGGGVSHPAIRPRPSLHENSIHVEFEKQAGVTLPGEDISPGANTDPILDRSLPPDTNTQSHILPNTLDEGMDIAEIETHNSTIGIDNLSTSKHVTSIVANETSVNSIMGLKNLYYSVGDNIVPQNTTLHTSATGTSKLKEPLDNVVVGNLHKSMNESNSLADESKLNSTMGLNSLYKLVKEDVNAPEYILLPSTSFESSFTNSPISIDISQNSTMDLNNSYKSIHEESVNSLVLNSITTIDNHHKSMNESVYIKDEFSNDSSEDLKNYKSTHEESVNSSVLNSTTGIDKLYISMNESISVTNESSPDSNKDLKNSYKSTHEESVNSSVLNSTTGIDKLYISMNESISVTNESSPDSNKDLKNSYKSTHEESVNSSALNSTTGIDKLDASMNESVTAPDVSSQDIIIGLSNFDKSFEEGTAQGKRWSCNSSSHDANISNTLNSSVTNTRLDNDKLCSKLRQSIPLGNETSLNSTVGFTNLYKSVDEVSPAANSLLRESSFIASNTVDGSFNNFSLNSTLGLGKLYRSTNENISTMGLSNLKESVNSSICVGSKNIPDETLNNSGLSSSTGIDKLYTSLDASAVSNTSSANLCNTIDEDGSINISHGKCCTTNAKECSCMLQHLKTNVGDDGYLSTDFDKSVVGYSTNLRNTDLFPVKAEIKDLNQEEDELVKEEKELDKTENRNYIDIGNTTKYALKDIEETVCVDNILDEVSSRLRGLKSAEDIANVTSEDMEVTMIREHSANNQLREVFSGQSETLNRSIDEKSFNIEKPFHYIDEDHMETTTPNNSRATRFIFQKPSMVQHFNEVERNYNNPELTILGEETILLSQSVIYPDQIKLNSLHETNKLLSATSSPMCKIPKLENENFANAVNKSVSLDKTSICALDYSLPLSDCTGLLSETLISNRDDNLLNVSKSLGKSVVRRDVKLRKEAYRLCANSSSGLESLDNSQSRVANTSDTQLWWDSFTKDPVSSPASYLPVSKMSAEERRLLSETINNSIFSKTLSPQEDVNSLKEHLLVVMDLLEKENSDFEAFQKSCESEKLKLLSKITLLENQISNIKDSEMSNFSEEKKIPERFEVKDSEVSCSSCCEEVVREVEYLRSLCVLTEREVPQLSELMSKLESWGVSTEGLTADGSRSLVHAKSVLNVLSSLLLKHNSFLARQNHDEQALLEKDSEIARLRDESTHLHAALQENQHLLTQLKLDVADFNLMKESLHKYQLESDVINEHLSKTDQELLFTKEKYEEILTKFESLEKEYTVSTDHCEFLNSENKILLNEVDKFKKNLLNLEGVQKECSELQKYNETLTEKCISFENNLSEMASQCENYSKLNENLLSEIDCLNSLLVQNMRNTEENSLRVKEEYNLLKTKFEERSSLLNKIICEIGSTEKINDLINTQLENINQTLLSETNLILRPEFKSLLLQFEEINLKFHILDNDKTQLSKKYAEAVEKITFLESGHSNEVELKYKYIEEVSTLSAKLTEISQSFSDLQTEYNSILSQNDSGKTQLAALNAQLQDLNSKYDESLTNLTQLQETCFEKSENNKLLDEMVSALNLNIKQQNDNLSELKHQFNDLLLKYEDKSSKLKVVQNDYLLLEEKYIATERIKEDMQKLANDKETYIAESARKIEPLLEELNILKESSSIINEKFDELSSQYENECSNSTALKSELNNMHQKYHESLETIQKLESVCLDKDATTKKLEEEMSNLLLEAKSIKMDLTETCNVLEGELSAERRKVESFMKEKEDMESRLGELSERVKQATTASEDLAKQNHSYTLEIGNLNLQISILNEECRRLQDKVSNLEANCATLSSEISGLQGNLASKCEEYAALEELSSKLEAKSHQATNRIEELQEDDRIIQSKLSTLEATCSTQSSDISGLQGNLATKCEEYAVLKRLNTKLEIEYEQATNQIEELQYELSNVKIKCTEYAALKGLNSDLEAKYQLASNHIEKLESELSNLNIKLEGYVSLEGVNTTLEAKYQQASNYIEELQSELSNLKSMCAEYSALEGINADLQDKYQLASSHIVQLQSELSSLKIKCEEYTVLEGHNAELEAKYLQATNKIEELQEEGQTFQSKLSSLETNCVTLSSEISALQGNLTSKCEEYVVLERFNTELEEKFQHASNHIEELQSELSNLQSKCAEYAALEGLNTELNAKYQQATNDIDELQEEGRRLQGELSNLEANCDSLSSVISGLENNLARKCEEYTVLEGRWAELESKYQIATNQLQEQLEEGQKFQRKLSSVEENCSKLSCHVLVLEGNLASKSEECAALKGHNSELEAKYQQATNHIMDLQEEGQRFQSQLCSLEANCASLSSDISRFKDNFASKSEEYAVLEGQYTELEAKYLQATNKIEELQEEGQTFQSKLSSLESNCVTLSSEISELQGNLTSKCEEYDVLEGFNTELEEKYQQSSNRIEELQSELSNLQSKCAEYAALEGLNTELNAKYQQATNDIDELQEEGRRLQGELSNLETNCVTLSSEISALQGNLTSKCEEYVVLEGFNTELEVKYQQSSNHIEELQSELSNLQSKCAEYAGLEGLNTELNAKYQQATNHVDELQEEGRRLQGELSNLEANCDSLSSVISGLENNLARKCEEYTVLEGRWAELESKYQQATTHIEELEKDSSHKLEVNTTLQHELAETQKQLVLMKDSQISLESEINKITSLYAEEETKLLVVREDYGKLKAELVSEKTLRDELEVSITEVKGKCSLLEGDLDRRRLELEECKCLEEQLRSEKASLESEKEQLSEETSQLSLEVQRLSQDLAQLNSTNAHLEQELEQKHSELTKAQINIENFNHYQELIANLVADFPILRETFSDGDFTFSDSSVFEVFFHSVEKVLNDFSQVIKESSENKSLLVTSEEEVKKLKESVDSLMAKLQDTQAAATDAKGSFISLKNKYELLLDAHTAIKENFQSLTQQSNNINIENNQLKITNNNLIGELEEKNRLVQNLCEVQHKFQALSNDHNNILSELSKKCQENDNIMAEQENNRKEISSLRESKCDLEIENKKLKSDNLKYQKEYQNSIDNLRKTREELCSLEKNCDEKMSRFTFVLKEKQEFENRTLQLLKQNDELSANIRDLTAKVFDQEKSFSKFLELQTAHSILSEEKRLLQDQLVEYHETKKEIVDLKACIATKDSKINEILIECKQAKDNYQLKTTENQDLVNIVCGLVPEVGNFNDVIKFIEEKMKLVKSLEEELEEEKLKCGNLDEECNILNSELTYKDKMIGDMYTEHSERVKALTESIENNLKISQDDQTENLALKQKVTRLEADIFNLKTSQPALCTECALLRESLRKSKISLVERNAKITSLEQHLEGFQSSYKKKVHEYRKKIRDLQEELSKGAGEVKGKTSAEASSQTDAPQDQVPAQAGIVHLTKIREQEEKIHKMEKENHVLKKVCHNRHQMIKDLQGKLDMKSSEEGKRPRLSSKPTPFFISASFIRQFLPFRWSNKFHGHHIQNHIHPRRPTQARASFLKCSTTEGSSTLLHPNMPYRILGEDFSFQRNLFSSIM